MAANRQNPGHWWVWVHFRYQNGGFNKNDCDYKAASSHQRAAAPPGWVDATVIPFPMQMDLWYECIEMV
jgi:hypothetical protein